MKRKKGIWIAFEGNDGSGKSTQLELVADYLQDKGFEVIKTREPGGNDFSEDLRKLIFNKEVAEDPITQLYLFVSARRRNILDVVLPALNSGKIVLSDRSEGSTYAYQHFQFGLPKKIVSQVNDLATEGVKPNITFLLDVDIKVGANRVKKAKKDQTNHFDEANTQNWMKRKNGFLKIAKQSKGWFVVDGNQSKDDVFKNIVSIVNKKFNVD